MTTQYCLEGGQLVGADHWFPDDAYDFDWGSAGPAIGCNRLVCTECKTRVRQCVGLEVKPNARVESRVLAGLTPSHWNRIDTLTVSTTGRVYACQCAVYVMHGARRMAGAGGDPLHGPRVPWRCGGHPVVDTPSAVDGVAVDANTDWREVAAHVFRGTLPAHRPWIGLEDKRHPAFWLARLVVLVSDPAVRDAVASAAADCLADSDLYLRRGAINFFRFHPLAPGAERVTHLWSTRPTLFDGVQDPDRARRTLARYAREVVDARISKGCTDAIEFAKTALHAGRGEYSFLYRLQQVDPSWLHTHVRQLASANPHLSDAMEEMVEGD